MPNPKIDDKSVYIDREENITRADLSAKKVALYTYDAATDTLIPGTGGSGGDGAILDGVNSAIKATVKDIGVQITTNDHGLVTNTVMHGLTTGGGGGYVDVKVNPSGALTVESTISGTVVAFAKSTEQYAINNKEATATYKYFGFQKSDGGWYIMRKTIATNIFEYVAGASAYSTAWTNRASQTYTDYATAF